MTVVGGVGWVATVVGAGLSVPQLVRLARTRDIGGLSLIGWQACLAINLGWGMHGLSIGQAPQFIASTFGLLTTVPILLFMARALGRGAFATLLPGVAMAATMIAVDRFIGSAAFGVYAILPAVIALGGQSVELVRAPVVRGISTPSLLLGGVNQALWMTWSFLVADPGSIISGLLSCAFVGFNLVWFAMRRAGLRALFVTTEPVLEPAVVGCDA